jgi:hypothetical protein
MVVEEEEVRAGHTGDGVRYVLLASLGLALLALAVSLALFTV